MRSKGTWYFFSEIEKGNTRQDTIYTVKGVRISQRVKGLERSLATYGITKDEVENAILEELERLELDSSMY